MTIADGFVISRPLGDDNNNNDFESTNVVANADGSLIERAEYIQQVVDGLADVINADAVIYGGPNYIRVPITFAALTTGAVGSHEILTVTGAVRVRIIPECTVNVAGAGTIELGVAGDTDIMLGTTTGTDIDAGKFWLDTSPAELAFNFSSVIDKVIAGGLDIGYEIKTDTLTGGEIVFHCFYEPLNNTGAVVAADGTGGL